MGDDKFRDLVAQAADIKSHPVTQFSPDGFREAIEQPFWWCVSLGPLALCHDGAWVYMEKDENVRQRLRYAFRTGRQACNALEKAVAPSKSWLVDLLRRRLGADE
jgi:hypothetical protein